MQVPRLPAKLLIAFTRLFDRRDRPFHLLADRSWPNAATIRSALGSRVWGLEAAAQRRQGIARALLEQFTSSAEDHGVKTIFTLVNNDQPEMKDFFDRLGFAQGKMQHFQKEVTP